MDFAKKSSYDIGDLLAIMELLRAPEGCPWDREQDHHSIRKNFIEETYEVAEAIDAEDPELLCEELGDVLLQVVFHAQMEKEIGRFDFSDVCDGICKKLIGRHPHVFGDVAVADSGEVLRNWDSIKREEKHRTTHTQSLDSVPKTLPALMRGEKVQGRAAKAGFDYPDLPAAMKDLHSEVRELEEAIAGGDAVAIEEELGDLLFSAVNVSRFAAVDAEQALGKSSDKFIRRFAVVEEIARQRGIDMASASMELLDNLWQEAKNKK